MSIKWAPLTSRKALYDSENENVSAGAHFGINRCALWYQQVPRYWQVIVYWQTSSSSQKWEEELSAGKGVYEEESYERALQEAKEAYENED
jgi:hypothetical protein